MVLLVATGAFYFLASGLGSPRAAPGSSATAAPAVRVIATLGAPTPISAYRGRLLWSERDAAGRFHLVSVAGGAPARLPVRPRRVAFDADLGPDRDGHVAAVYSRCRRDPPPGAGYGAPTLYQRGRGCDVYEYDFADARERRVAAVSSPVASEAWPTIWRSRVAFERVYDDRRATAYLYVRRLGSGRGSRRLAAGPGRGHATGTDLAGRRLAFGWTFTGRGEGLDTEIRLDVIGGRHSAVAHQGGGGLTHVSLQSPSIDGGWLYWAQGCWGDEGGCPGRYGLRRRPTAGGPVQRAAGPRRVISATHGAGHGYIVRDTGYGACVSDPGNAPTCRLLPIDPPYR